VAGERDNLIHKCLCADSPEEAYDRARQEAGNDPACLFLAFLHGLHLAVAAQ